MQVQQAAFQSDPSPLLLIREVASDTPNHPVLALDSSTSESFGITSQIEEKQVLTSLGAASGPSELVFVIAPQCPRLLPDHYWTMGMQGARGRSGDRSECGSISI